MRRSVASWLDRHPGAPVYAVAGALIGLAAVHVAMDDDRLLDAGLQGLVVGLIAILPFAVAVRVREKGFEGRQLLHVFGITIGGAVYGTALCGSFIALMIVEGGTYDEPMYGVLVGLAGGVGFGAPIGYYYQALRRQQTKLRDQVERTRSLNKRLRVTERALRPNLRNELTILYGIADELAEAFDGLPIRRSNARLDHLAALSENTRRLTQIRDVEGTAELDVGELLAAQIDDVSPTHPELQFDEDGISPARVRVHPNFEYAIDETLDNAVRHNDTEELHVDVAVTTDDDWATVTITDDGSGIPSLDTVALARPEETPLEHGRGLGLWVIYCAVESSGGALSFQNDGQDARAGGLSGGRRGADGPPPAPVRPARDYVTSSGSSSSP
jgi:signal transduction histidine kinase